MVGSISILSFNAWISSSMSEMKAIKNEQIPMNMNKIATKTIHAQMKPITSMHMVAMYGIGCFQSYGNLV